MTIELKRLLERGPIKTSAPCRVDMGGTLDLPVFFYQLRRYNPCTVNLALSKRTHVQLLPYRDGRVKISSKGFKPADFAAEKAAFDHPLGLMFAVASFFNAGGVHIQIESQSPPRSALGGSSAAAVALVAAFSKATSAISSKSPARKKCALLAQVIEETVAGVQCGYQDQLAAAYGGVNIWQWLAGHRRNVFSRKTVLNSSQARAAQDNILVAFCGVPHQSYSVNRIWVNQFVSGKFRDHWKEIITCTREFSSALEKLDFSKAAFYMNRETAIRRKLTPNVLDDLGKKLVLAARKNGCGARFAGAGAGGCLWALGEVENIRSLNEIWQRLLNSRKTARLLDVTIDVKGLVFHD